MNVFRVEIAHCDGDPGTIARVIHVLARTAAEAVDRGAAFLKDDLREIPEQLADYEVVAVRRLMSIDWPEQPE